MLVHLVFLIMQVEIDITCQGFFYFSEVGARGLLNLEKYHLVHQSLENLMLSKSTGRPFKIDFHGYKKLAV